MVIAELCQNHLGKKELLFEMIEKAREAGCWGVKIQSFFADDLSPDFKNQEKRMKECELDWETQEQFVSCCIANKIKPLTSVYTTRYIPQLKKCGFSVIKLGSADSHERALFFDLKAAGFRVFCSTGGQNLKPFWGCADTIFHCVSVYPHTGDEANLMRMAHMMWRFEQCKIGFSDHSDPTKWDYNIASKTAIMMGADYIERHFTILGRNETKDGPVSLDLVQLKELCHFEKNFNGGLFINNQTENEISLIKKYQGRWIR